MNLREHYKEHYGDHLTKAKIMQIVNAHDMDWCNLFAEYGDQPTVDQVFDWMGY